MSDSERLKKKNLLLSYYAGNGNSNELSVTPSNNKNNALSSPSITTTNTTDNASFSSSNELYSVNTNHENTGESKDPYDINSTMFEADLFLKKMIRV